MRKKSRKIISLVITFVLVLSLSVTAFAATGTWKHNSKGWWYSYSDGGYAANKWEKISGKWYHFNSQGYMQTGWLKDGGKWYYLNTNGAMTTGWQKISNKWYYLGTSGAMATGWQKISNKWYYLGTNGVMVTGWQKISGKWYYFNTNGSMKTGWLKDGGKWYYLNKNGSMATSNVTVDGVTYIISSSGVWTGETKQNSETSNVYATIAFSGNYKCKNFKYTETVEGDFENVEISFDFVNNTKICHSNSSLYSSQYISPDERFSNMEEVWRYDPIYSTIESAPLDKYHEKIKRWSGYEKHPYKLIYFYDKDGYIECVAVITIHR